MKLVKKLFSSKDFLALFIVVVFGLLSSWSLFGRGYFNMHDDLQMMRQLEMEKCFLDLQIPCRWVPDMGYGHGFPLFNFYPPLPYIVGQVFRLVGFDFVSTAKGLFALALIASGITMYFLAREFFGKFGGIIAAIFYVWAPYHAVDVYVRGAMNESWALIWFPLIFWLSFKLIKEKKTTGWIIGLALAWFALLTSHNLMVLAFGLPFAVWCLIWVIIYKQWKKIIHLAISGVWALGLAAFFTFPAVVENKYTHIDSVLVGYYDYTGHFATINQTLFSRFWGYGPSVWLENDGMSFQIGQLHWIGSLVVLGLAGLRYWRTRKLDNITIILVFAFCVGWGAAFLTHAKSTPIWLTFTPLRYLQFPWRLLAIVILVFSFMIGALPFMLKDIKGKALSAILVLALVILNWNYFKPEHGKLGALTDQEKFSGAAWELQQTAGIYDYLPKEAQEAPRRARMSIAEGARGKIEIGETQEGTNWAKFNVKVEDEKAWARVGIMKFPGWVAYIDGQEVKPFVPEEEKWGRMWIEIPQGEHTVDVEFKNTPIRTVSDIVSVASWVLLAGFVAKSKRK